MNKNKKILVIGKKNHLGWIEHTINGFKENSYTVSHFYTNQLSLKRTVLKGIYKTFSQKKELNLQKDELKYIIKNFKPDFTVFIGAFFTHIELFQLCKEYKIPTIAWVGDKFSDDKEKYIDVIDHLFVTDSAFMDLALSIGFKNVNFLQFGYDKKLHQNLNINRHININFIGSYTKQRDMTFSKLINFPFYIYGSKWNKLSQKSKNWKIYNKKISQKEVAYIYNTSLATLNVAQKENITNMVNMRTFEAIACGSLLISDYVKDIELCFEPNKEVLLYNNLEDLESILDKVFKDIQYAKSIANNAYKRIKKENYSYKNRIIEMMRTINA